MVGLFKKENNDETKLKSDTVVDKTMKKLFKTTNGQSSPDGRFESLDGIKSDSKLIIKFNVGAGMTTPTATSKNAIGRSPFLYRAQYSQDRDFKKIVNAHQQTQSNTERGSSPLKNTKFTKSPVHDLNKPGRLIPDLVGGRGKNGNIHHVMNECPIEDELTDYISNDWVKNIKEYVLLKVTESLKSIKFNSRELCEKIFDPGSQNIPYIPYNTVHSAFNLVRDNTHNTTIPESQISSVRKIINELRLQTERLLHLDISEITMDKFLQDLRSQENTVNNINYDQNWSAKKFDINRRTLSELMSTLTGIADRIGGGVSFHSFRQSAIEASLLDNYKVAYSIFFPPSEKVEYGKHSQKYLDRIWKSRNSFDKCRHIHDIFGTTELDYEIIIAIFLRIMDKDSANIRYVTDLQTLRNTRKKLGTKNFIIGLVREEAPQNASRRYTSVIPHYNVFKAEGHVLTRFTMGEGENNLFEALVYVVLLCVKYNVRSRDTSDTRCVDMLKYIFTQFYFADFNELRSRLKDEYNLELSDDDVAEDE